MSPIAVPGEGVDGLSLGVLGGHVARCEDCAHEVISYNNFRNPHCPECQCAAARGWLAEREAELLPTPYYHVVFTLPAPAQRFAAAFLAISSRRSGVMAFALAAPPFLPSAFAAGSLPSSGIVSSISPVSTRMTW